MQNSSNAPADPEPVLAKDWACPLPQDFFQEIILVLRGALPPPGLDDPDGMTWQDWARRDRAAMAAVAALQPENATEGRLAARFVLADAWSSDSLREARERRHKPEVAFKSKAQAISLMRESNRAMTLLLRLQAARRATAGEEEAADRASRVEHGAAGMMGEALGYNLADEPDMPVASVEPEAAAVREVQPLPFAAEAAGGGRVAMVPRDVGKFRLDTDRVIKSLLPRSETPPRLWLPPVRAAS